MNCDSTEPWFMASQQGSQSPDCCDHWMQTFWLEVNLKNTVQSVEPNKGSRELLEKKHTQSCFLTCVSTSKQQPLKWAKNNIFCSPLNDGTTAHLPANFGWGDGSQKGARWKFNSFLTEKYFRVIFLNSDKTVLQTRLQNKTGTTRTWQQFEVRRKIY